MLEDLSTVRLVKLTNALGREYFIKKCSDCGAPINAIDNPLCPTCSASYVCTTCGYCKTCHEEYDPVIRDSDIYGAPPKGIWPDNCTRNHLRSEYNAADYCQQCIVDEEYYDCVQYDEDDNVIWE